MSSIMLLWFVLLSGNAGFIEPLNVDAAACSAPSPSTGTLVADREVNPRIVRWGNCLVDVSAYVDKLPQGVYEIAATDRGLPGYLAPDPHVSETIVVGADFEEQGTPARPTDKFAWTSPDPIASLNAYGWDLELDGVVQATRLATTCAAGTPNTCEAPIPAMTPSQHTIRIRPVDISVAASPINGPWSDPLTFTMRATPSKIGTPIIKPATPPGGDDHADAPADAPAVLVIDLGAIPAFGGGR